MSNIAFIVGANYNNSLDYAETDAERLADTLRTLNYEVMHIDPQIAPTELVKSLRRKLNSCKINDYCLFYYVGHGVLFGQNLHLTVNSSNPLDRDSFIPIDDIITSFKICSAGAKLIILDCCYSGALNRALNISEFTNLEVITAADAWQEVPEPPGLGGGFLGHHINKALKGQDPSVANNLGDITSSSLLSWLTERIKEYNACNQTEMPKLVKIGKVKNEFIIASIREQLASQKVKVSYVAHPYTLLQTKQIVGRTEELAQLDNWFNSSVKHVPVMAVVAIGGMGKSALTWYWFNQKLENLNRGIAGCFWWSFYSTDATFDAFLLALTSYVSAKSSEALMKLTQSERDQLLYYHLKEEKHLVVLDGLERILIAYSTMKVSAMLDEDLDKITGEFKYDRESNVITLKNKQAALLRRTINPEYARYLRTFSKVVSSKFVITSRLFPSDLINVNRKPLDGIEILQLEGLKDNDAVHLWESFGLTVEREVILSYFRTFKNYPLIIKSLAGEVASYFKAPGNFKQWLQDNPDFNPFQLSVTDARSHVLFYSFKGLNSDELVVLSTISAFRATCDYSTLSDYFIRITSVIDEKRLDEILNSLIDRGLIGWDAVNTQFDMHPVVRGVVWKVALDDSQRQKICDGLENHFTNVIYRIGTDDDSYDDSVYLDTSGNGNDKRLSHVKELFYILIEQGKLIEAFDMFGYRLRNVMLPSVHHNREFLEMFELFFFENDLSKPKLDVYDLLFRQGDHLDIRIGHLYNDIGKPRSALVLYQEHHNRCHNSLCKYRDARIFSNLGRFRECDAAYQEIYDTEGGDLLARINLFSMWGEDLLRRGNLDLVKSILEKAPDDNPFFYLLRFRYAYYVDDLSDLEELEKYQTDQSISQFDIHLIQQLCKAKIFLKRKEYDAARALLGKIINEGVDSGRIIYMHDAAIELADLDIQEGNFDEAFEQIDEIIDICEGVYPEKYARLLMLLARIDMEKNDFPKAKAYCERAYAVAGAQGRHYSFYWELKKAREMMEMLSLPIPPMEGNEMWQNEEKKIRKAIAVTFR